MLKKIISFLLVLFNTLHLNAQNQNSIIISLKYSAQTREPVLKNLERVSKPGIRVYARKKNISNVF